MHCLSGSLGPDRSRRTCIPGGPRHQACAGYRVLSAAANQHMIPKRVARSPSESFVMFLHRKSAALCIRVTAVNRIAAPVRAGPQSGDPIWLMRLAHRTTVLRPPLPAGRHIFPSQRTPYNLHAGAAGRNRHLPHREPLCFLPPLRFQEPVLSNRAQWQTQACVWRHCLEHQGHLM